MRYWLKVPYLIEPDITGKTVRRLAIDSYTPEILRDGGYWAETEIEGGDLDKNDGGSALVLVRSTVSQKNLLDKEFTAVDDPALFWPEGGMRMSHTGEFFPVRSIESVLSDVFTPEKQIEMEQEVLALIDKADRDGYTKLTGKPWEEASKLLVLAGKMGYNLDKISTGTFPVNGIISSFSGSNEDPISESGTWSSSNFSLYTNRIKVVSNKVTCASSSTYGASRHLTSHTANQESYITLSTVDAASSRFLSLGSRIPAGDTTDGYDINFIYSNGTSADYAYFYRVDNGTPTALGTSTTGFQQVNGYKFGSEWIGTTLTGYYNSGGGWSAVTTRTDSTYNNAGFMSLGASRDIIRLDDFGGGSLGSANIMGGLGLTGVGF